MRLHFPGKKKQRSPERIKQSSGTWRELMEEQRGFLLEDCLPALFLKGCT